MAIANQGYRRDLNLLETPSDFTALDNLGGYVLNISPPPPLHFIFEFTQKLESFITFFKEDNDLVVIKKFIFLLNTIYCTSL